MSEPGFNEGWPRWDLPRAIQPEVMERYYAALGRFMHEFAKTESALNHTNSMFVYERLKLGQMPPPGSEIIDALVGSLRLASARDTIKRLLRVTEAPKEITAEVDRVLKHLSGIHYFRDRIAHHGVDFYADKQGWFSTSNFGLVRERDQEDTISFTPEMLLDMAYDLSRIPDMIGDRIIDPDPDDFGGPEELEKHLASLREPFRHKPSELRRTGQSKRRTL